jgi:hypothetical protein
MVDILMPECRLDQVQPIKLQIREYYESGAFDDVPITRDNRLTVKEAREILNQQGVVPRNQASTSVVKVSSFKEKIIIIAGVGYVIGGICYLVPPLGLAVVTFGPIVAFATWLENRT